MTHLLPLLKFIVPVAGLTIMGGGVYFIGGIVPKKDPGKPLKGVYLLVKGTVAQDNSHDKELTTKEKVNEVEKTTKNYFCQLQLEASKTIEDKSCSLFNLKRLYIPKKSGSSTTEKSQVSAAVIKPQEAIDINLHSFKESNLTNTKNSVTTDSFHILKVSQEFYDSLTWASKTEKKAIKLVDKTTAGKHFGSVKEVVKLNLKTETDINDPRASLFLARITAPEASLTGSVTQPLSCKIGDEKPIDCNIYTLESTYAKSNNLNRTKLTNLTKVSTLSATNLPKDNYVVIELTKSQLRLSELRNKTISIYKSSDLSTPSNKIADMVFDQLLIGQINATNSSSSTILPIAEKRAAYLVEKVPATPSDQSSFTGLQGADSRNYKCKFTINDHINYDDSCILQTFPSTTKAHTYASLTTSTTQGFAEISSTDRTVEQFLMTFDARKLFNLKPDWNKDLATDIVVSLERAEPNKSISFKLLQELKATKAIGKTNLVFVKYKSSESINGAAATGKCALTESDTVGVDCAFHKATMTDNLPSAFAQESSGSQPPLSAANLATNDHFAVKFTNYKNIKEFDGKNLFFYTTVASQNKKITFDVVATMGGSLVSNKAFYFLEGFRGENAAQASASAGTTPAAR